MKIQRFGWMGLGLLPAWLAGGCTTDLDHGSSGQYGAVQQTTSHAGMQQSMDNAEVTVPYAAPLIYPENWPELSRRRQSEQLGGK